MTDTTIKRSDISTINLDATARQLGLRIRVRGLKMLSLRMRLAAAVLRLGGWVSGVPITVDTQDSPAP